jgi:hypothetical protein
MDEHSPSIGVALSVFIVLILQSRLRANVPATAKLSDSK